MRIAVFGLGLTGVETLDLARRMGWRAAGFSRSRGAGEGRRFDAARRDDCLRMKRDGARFDGAVATFPPEEVWPGFWEILAEISPNSILLGTTGSYLREGVRPTITEETATRADHPRRPAEDAFRDAGGVLMRLSGIYGGPRNPLRWVERGRVGYEDRQVNLVHCGDVAAALATAFLGKPKRRLYNLSDGQPHTWRRIIDYAVELGWIRHDRIPAPPRRADSFVDNGRFLGEYPKFRFRDFWAELGRMAGQPAD